MNQKKNIPLEILLVHESTVIRNILQEYILTDHPDAKIDFPPSADEIPSMLKGKKYDLVFSGLEMEKTGGLAVQEYMKKSARNRETPLIVMTPTDTRSQRDFLARRGIRRILPLPCTSIQFRNLIYRIFNPESNTGRIFYTMPESGAVIDMEDGPIPAEIISISTDSIICGLDWRGERHPLTRARSVTLQFPADYGKASTISIRGRLLGIKDSIRVHREHPDRVRVNWKVAWNLFELRAATKKSLKLQLGESRTSPEKAPVPVPEEQTEKNPETEPALLRENESLKTALEIRTLENEKLLQKISRLRKTISELEKTHAEMIMQRTAGGSLINEKAVPTGNSRKLSIFKKIIEDNVKIRKG